MVFVLHFQTDVIYVILDANISDRSDRWKLCKRHLATVATWILCNYPLVLRCSCCSLLLRMAHLVRWFTYSRCSKIIWFSTSQTEELLKNTGHFLGPESFSQRRARKPKFVGLLRKIGIDGDPPFSFETPPFNETMVLVGNFHIPLGPCKKGVFNIRVMGL